MSRTQSSNVPRGKLITSDQVENLRGMAHRLLERLTVVSGYGEIALERRCHPDVERDLKKIVGAARTAKQEILSGVAVLDSLPPCAFTQESD